MNTNSIETIITSSVQMLIDEYRSLQVKYAELYDENESLKFEVNRLKDSLERKEKLIAQLQKNVPLSSLEETIDKVFLRGENWINAIKEVRNLTDWGLKETKDFVEDYMSKKGYEK